MSSSCQLPFGWTTVCPLLLFNNHKNKTTAAGTSKMTTTIGLGGGFFGGVCVATNFLASSTETHRTPSGNRQYILGLEFGTRAKRSSVTCVMPFAAGTNSVREQYGRTSVTVATARLRMR